MSFPSIPTELLREIFQHLRTRDLLSIAITCKSFHALAMLQIYHSIFLRNNTAVIRPVNRFCDLDLSTQPKFLETFEHWSSSRQSSAYGLGTARQTTIVRDLESLVDTLRKRPKLGELVKFVSCDRWAISPTSEKHEKSKKRRYKIGMRQVAACLAPKLRHLWLCSLYDASKAFSPQTRLTHLVVDCFSGIGVGNLRRVFLITSLKDLTLLNSWLDWSWYEPRTLTLPALSSFVITSTHGPFPRSGNMPSQQKQMLRWPASLEKVMVHIRPRYSDEDKMRPMHYVCPTTIFDSLSHLKTHLKEIWITALGPTANDFGDPLYSCARHFSALRHLSIPFSFYQTAEQHYGRVHQTTDTRTHIWRDLPFSLEILHLQVEPGYWYAACHSCAADRKASRYGRLLVRELDSIKSHKDSCYPRLKNTAVWSFTSCEGKIHEVNRSCQGEANECGIEQGGHELQQRFKDEGIDLSFWRTPDPFLHFPSWRNGKKAS